MLTLTFLAAIEENISMSAGKYAVGDNVTLVRLTHTQVLIITLRCHLIFIQENVMQTIHVDDIVLMSCLIQTKNKENQKER